MKEDFLHFIWKFRLFNSLELETTEGEKIEILKTGIHNHDSGPDFSMASVKIGDKIWNGNVEIHIHSSDWTKHNHQNDMAYGNVILHVVYENDKNIYLHNPGDLPVLVLKNLILPEYLSKYNKLNLSKDWIPCASQFPEIDSFKLNSWLERLAILRMQRKSAEVIKIYYDTDKDWNETYYRWIFRSFGFKINSGAFQNLAEIIPRKILKKHAHSLFQIEALLFGQAGILNVDFSEDYPNKLKKEYLFLAKKYELKSMNVTQWKFSKTFPSNFPTKRIAQLAAFMSTEKISFDQVVNITDVQMIKDQLRSETSEYWKTHYKFGNAAKSETSNKMGEQSANNILINTVATVIFTYGKKVEKEEIIDLALGLLDSIKPESNSIIKNWKSLGVRAGSAKETQALIELKREKCEKKKCLTCVIGAELIRSSI